MSRHVTAAIVVALFASPLPLSAQTTATTVFTVDTASANVHKGPSTGSPVIGSAARGASLEVTRELGSWVKVVWAMAPDKVGYVHVSTGKIARGSSRMPRRTAAIDDAGTNGAARATPSPAPASPPIPPPPSASAAYRDGGAAPAPRGYVRPPEHTLGVGGRAGGPTFGVGLAARAWTHEHFGLQVELSRMTPDGDPVAPATIELAPSVMFALPDHVSDYWWLRPYVGGGPSLQHRGSGVLGENDPLSGTRFAFQAFGGAEFTLSGLPQFAVSADAGYRQQPAYVGPDRVGFGVVISGHWYFR